MHFLDLKDIAERDIELVNPISPEKIIASGRAAGLDAGQRVIDFGCGYAEPLALWAEHFGVTGVGVERRPKACERARAKVRARGLDRQIEIVCGDAAAHAFEPGAYDAAACIGASFIWGGYPQALRAMRPALKPDGVVLIGEPYWTTSRVPSRLAQAEPFHTEHELATIAWGEGFEMAHISRASHEDWDRYETANWRGYERWLRENPAHPDREAVFAQLRVEQDEYVRHGREHFGWAVYVLVQTRALGMPGEGRPPTGT